MRNDNELKGILRNADERAEAFRTRSSPKPKINSRLRPDSIDLYNLVPIVYHEQVKLGCIGPRG